MMRSRKVSPGFWVISITIRSESTLVPPVTALRSPPASRITGADSPVMADSSTDAIPSITSPSPGMMSPAGPPSPPCLADHRSGLACDGGFINRRDTLDHVAVAGDDVAGFADDQVALAELSRRHAYFYPVDDPARDRFGPRLAQRRRLGLASAFGDRLGEVGKENGEPQPDRDLAHEQLVVAPAEGGRAVE